MGLWDGMGLSELPLVSTSALMCAVVVGGLFAAVVAHVNLPHGCWVVPYLPLSWVVTLSFTMRRRALRLVCIVM